jgi:hypothetical protein
VAAQHEMRFDHLSNPRVFSPDTTAFWFYTDKAASWYEYGVLLILHLTAALHYSSLGVGGLCRRTEA